MTFCEFEEFEQPDVQGRRRVRCRNCGLVTPAPTIHPVDRVFARCKAGDDTDRQRREPAWKREFDHVPLVHEALAVSGESFGLGDAVAAGLDAVGVTKERVQAWWGDCGCAERQERLNKLGRRIASFLRGESST